MLVRETWSAEAALRERADSFVVETDVHYPADLNLLWDALGGRGYLALYRACPLSFDYWKQKAALKAAKEGGVI